MPELKWTRAPESSEPGEEYYWQGHDENGQLLACVIVNRFVVAIQYRNRPGMSNGQAKLVQPATEDVGKAMCDALFEAEFSTHH